MSTCRTVAVDFGRLLINVTKTILTHLVGALVWSFTWSWVVVRHFSMTTWTRLAQTSFVVISAFHTSIFLASPAMRKTSFPCCLFLTLGEHWYCTYSFVQHGIWGCYSFSLHISITPLQKYLRQELSRSFLMNVIATQLQSFVQWIFGLPSTHLSSNGCKLQWHSTCKRTETLHSAYACTVPMMTLILLKLLLIEL